MCESPCSVLQDVVALGMVAEVLGHTAMYAMVTWSEEVGLGPAQLGQTLMRSKCWSKKEGRWTLTSYFTLNK